MRRSVSPYFLDRAAERRIRDRIGDRFAGANCPVCRAPLVVRVDGRGPYFFCRCVGRQSSETREG